MTLNPGDVAPIFSLPDAAGKLVSLADFRGQRVVLYFYPRDNTPGCTKEACAFRDISSRTGSHGKSVFHEECCKPVVNPNTFPCRTLLSKLGPATPLNLSTFHLLQTLGSDESYIEIEQDSDTARAILEQYIDVIQPQTKIPLKDLFKSPMEPGSTRVRVHRDVVACLD